MWTQSMPDLLHHSVLCSHLSSCVIALRMLTLAEVDLFFWVEVFKGWGVPPHVNELGWFGDKLGLLFKHPAVHLCTCIGESLCSDLHSTVTVFFS